MQLPSLSRSAGSPNVATEQGISAVTSMNWCDGFDLHIVVRMNLAVTNLAAHGFDKRLNMLVHIPSVHTCEWCSAQGFQALG